jgi:hypothetical protein
MSERKGQPQPLSSRVLWPPNHADNNTSPLLDQVGYKQNAGRMLVAASPQIAATAELLRGERFNYARATLLTIAICVSAVRWATCGAEPCKAFLVLPFILVRTSFSNARTQDLIAIAWSDGMQSGKSTDVSVEHSDYIFRTEEWFNYVTDDWAASIFRILK